MLQFEELNLELSSYEDKLKDLAEALGLKAMAEEVKELEEQSAQDGFWDDVQNSQKIVQRTATLKNKIKAYDDLKAVYEDTLTLIDLANEEEDESLFDNLEVIDADGLYVAPGLVDVHVHFRDPGFLYKEDIETGAKAAAKGGFTTVVLMANTKPIVDNEETLAYVLEKGKTTDIHVETCCSVSKEFKGQELCDYEKLLEKGAVGFTDDGIPLLDEGLVTEAMTEIAKLGVPISLHEEDSTLITNNGVNRGKASEYFQIGGSPREAEITMVARDIEIANSLFEYFSINLFCNNGTAVRRLQNLRFQKIS